MQVDCGTYYIVADTYSNGNGEFAGAFDLSVDYTPQAGACGTRTGYDYLGLPGGECAFPGNPALSYCNPNLGATTCLYTGETSNDDSFCTMECDSNADCTDDFAGGCCVELQAGEHFCMPSGYCDGGTTDPDAGTSEPDSGTSEPDSGTSEPDSGTSEPDSGTSEPDSGTSEPDSGTSEPEPDSGTSEPDSGTSEPEPDSGTTDPEPDSGTIDPDRPDNDPNDGNGGVLVPGNGGGEGSSEDCSVASVTDNTPSPVGALVLTLFLGLVWLRRS